MPIGRRRNSVLYGLGAKRGSVHRYTWIRWIVGIAFTAIIALLPLTGTLRLDLWGGEHRYLGEPVDFVRGAKAFAFPFLAINIVIIVASRLIGRYLCGFVCPVGSLARLGEWVGWRKREGHGTLYGRITLLGLSVLLSAIAFSFWVDWRIFIDGSRVAKAVGGTALVTLTLGFFALVSGLGLRFCREICPSGVYFALLGPKTSSGIEFAHPQNCTDCHACESVCPMDLEPRRIAAEPTRSGMGLYPDGLSNHAVCIRCGDCVAACEGTTAQSGLATPLALGWLGAQGSDGAAPISDANREREGSREEPVRSTDAAPVRAADANDASPPADAGAP